MKTSIVQADVIPIRAPRKESVRSGLNPGDPVSASEFGILRILTESGLEGLGEISITFPRIGHSLCHAAAGLIAPALIGRDSLARPQALAEIDRLLAGELSAPYLRAAFEMALLDLAGKPYGVTAYISDPKRRAGERPLGRMKKFGATPSPDDFSVPGGTGTFGSWRLKKSSNESLVYNRWQPGNQNENPG